MSLDEIRPPENEAAAPGRKGCWPIHGWIGLLLVSVFWAWNWLAPGLRTHWGFFPLWLGYCLTGGESLTDLQFSLFCSLSFSTVIPAVFGTAELAGTAGPIDDSAEVLFREYLHPLVGQPATNVILDLSKSNFITSKGSGDATLFQHRRWPCRGDAVFSRSSCSRQRPCLPSPRAWRSSRPARACMISTRACFKGG